MELFYISLKLDIKSEKELVVEGNAKEDAEVSSNLLPE